ncbi:PAS domain S-box protein [Halostella sp. JP-L12]|uniref:ATP-binding protein n=1 Tax=Halostella TaxID=1843185 RepID=UPI000EF7E164|nr:MULTISPECIES: ATP-binding protein [Halostella]NHN46086.1 PAS domain S-box protein [Halostella sp. JP-L12]
MSRPLTLLFVASDPARRSEIAAAVAAHPDLSADVVAPGDVPDRPAADCLVADGRFVDGCRHHDVAVPIVAWSDDDPASVTTDGVAGYVRYDPEDPDVAAVVDQAAWALQTESSREKIEQLHASAADIVACRTEQELFDRTVEAAERVLAFDICGIDIVEDGHFVPKSVSDGMAEEGFTRIPVEEGVAGRTYRRDESLLIDDLRDDPDAQAAVETYRSVLSVPFGEDGLFQAAAKGVGAFDERDRELAELLLAHVEETLKRIRAEAALREHEAELVTERDRLAALFENVPDAVVSYEFEDGAPIVTDVNGRFEEVFGYDADEVVGEDVDDYIVPPDRDGEAADLNEALLAGERLQVTSRRKTADGVRDFLLHVVPLEVGERSVQGYSIYTDITDQKRRERELRRQNERLDEFASIVSHDLRNPLNVAEGFLDLARDTDDPEHFEQVAEAHDRMSRMIDELLSLARRGDIVGDAELVELRSAAADAWSAVDTGDSALAVETDLVVDADPDRLADLLSNLFRNSVEHADAPVTVRVGETEGDADGSRGFFVADDGPGIPADERERVFESGYTTRENGTGYGLPIVEQIAEAHGWDVAVTDSEDGGARFEFAVASA